MMGMALYSGQWQTGNSGVGMISVFLLGKASVKKVLCTAG